MAYRGNGNAGPATTGKVLHWEAWVYDLLTWLLLLGRVRVFREKVMHLAGLQPGEAVLDVGCGTGTLAIAAKQQVGTAGTVHGIDASPEMIAGAITKANQAGVEVVFQEVRRVLKPGGRVLAVDFARAAGGERTLIGHIHRHGGLQLGDILAAALVPSRRAALVDPVAALRYD